MQGWDKETYEGWMGVVRGGRGVEAGLGVSWGGFFLERGGEGHWGAGELGGWILESAWEVVGGVELLGNGIGHG